jgi:subtilase family serine protease
MIMRTVSGERQRESGGVHRLRLRYRLAVTAAAVLGCAGVAAAAPMRPALSSLPFVEISASAAKAAHTTTVCPNGLVCYSPSHLRDAYDFPKGKDAPSGVGQTIIVVEAYGSDTIGQDLAQFDAENGLAGPPSFTTVNQQTPVTGEGSGDLDHWKIETSLDVEYAHAMAPGANIVLAVALTDDTRNVAQLVSEVLPRYPGAIVSQSFGTDEVGPASDPGAAAILDAAYQSHILTGGTVLASSGDFGASDFTPFVGQPVPMAAYPAVSPFVLAVGGTEGDPFPDGLWRSNGSKYGGEQAWNELTPRTFPGAGASGGAPSRTYAAPAWQQAVTGKSMRAEPDVAYNAANNGGVIVVASLRAPGQHGVVGGTSAGTPQWAAIVALANELRGRQGRLPLGLATPQLYAIGADRKSYREDFHDIILGNNALFGDPTQLPGFAAGPGYDLPTGLGTPVVSKLLTDLTGRENSGHLDGLAGSAHSNPGHSGDVQFKPGG